MADGRLLDILAEWKGEFDLTLAKNNSIGIALFATKGDLLFANTFMKSFFQGEAQKSIRNL